jgi:hypothetical protein
MTSVNYTREEEERLLGELRSGRVPACPRCGHRLVDQRVAPQEGVPYVRDRLWLTCEGCHRTLVLDRRRFDESR